MPEYCGVYHKNPYHLLGLHDLFEGRGERSVEQVVAQLKQAAEIAGKDQTPEGRHLAEIYNEHARDFPKIAVFEGERQFRERESAILPRHRLERPDFGEHLESLVRQYFSKRVLPFCASRSDKVEGDPVLHKIKFGGVWPVLKDRGSLSKDDPRFKPRPVAEALEMYPDYPEFFVEYILVLDREGFQAWSDCQHTKEWSPWSRTFLNGVQRLL